MILKSPDKHLTDQEFFTYIKFDNLVFKHGNHGEEDDIFQLSDLRIGKEDLWEVFTRIFQTCQVLEIKLKINKEDDFDKEIAEARKSVEKRPKKDKENLLKIIETVSADKPINFEQIAAVSWVASTPFFRHCFSI